MREDEMSENYKTNPVLGAYITNTLSSKQMKKNNNNLTY